jgi:hypothetical protein
MTIDTDTLTSYDDRIRQAYRNLIHDLDRQPGDFVSLTDLRPYVGGHREHVDAALRRMGRGSYPDKRVALIPESNQKTLRSCDRQAAVRLGDQDLHCLAIA